MTFLDDFDQPTLTARAFCGAAAKSEYTSAIEKACLALEQIKAGIIDHAVDQTAGNWGHVGDMKHLASRLTEIADEWDRSRAK